MIRLFLGFTTIGKRCASKDRKHWKRITPVKEKNKRINIINNNIVDEWKLRNGKRWESLQGKANQGPNLSFGSKPYLCFHIKCHCFTDINH